MTHETKGKLAKMMGEAMPLMGKYLEATLDGRLKASELRTAKNTPSSSTKRSTSSRATRKTESKLILDDFGLLLVKQYQVRDTISNSLSNVYQFSKMHLM